MTDYSNMGGTKKAEYRRTVELLEEIYTNQGLYFVLALLWDAGYTRADIKAMMDMIDPGYKEES